MTDTLEHTAKRIADRGRDALIARLRPAFADAASVHDDLLRLDEHQLEQMVQRAADHADGVQWRTALAAVATEELGIGLGEALGHPAVERAQAIVGAPAYEVRLPPAAADRAERESQEEFNESAEPEEEAIEPETLAVAPVMAPAPSEHRAAVSVAAATPPSGTRPATPPSGTRPATHAGARRGSEVSGRHESRTPTDLATEAPTRRVPKIPDRPPADPPDGLDQLRIAAIHLGGVTSLRPGEGDIELRFSEHGLDIARDADEILGRLAWSEIDALEVPAARRLLVRRREPRAHLVVRTEHGDASFEIPSVFPEELREHLEPVLARYGRHLAA